MFKSVFTKMLFVYILLITVIILIVSSAISRSLNIYFLKSKEQSLLAQADKVKALVQSYEDQKLEHESLNKYIEAVGNVTNTRIVVLNVSENFLERPGIADKIKTVNGIQVFEDIKKILKGETIVKKRQFSAQLNTDVVFVGVPIEKDGEINGVILLFSPLNEVDRALKNIYRVIRYISVFAIIISSIIIYFVSLNISRPILKISSAAKKIADGEFNDTIEVQGEDEIAMLSHSFNYMNSRLQKVEKMRKELIANVSHDLKTPLTSLKCIIEGMIDGIIENHEYDSYLITMHCEIDRLTRLVGDLLELAKLQTGNVKLNRIESDINDIINSIIKTFVITNDEKDVKIDVEIAENVNIIYADVDRLKQILINLINNSIKYSKANPNIKLNVFTRGDSVFFEVIDNGIGISENELPYVFEKFYRVEKSRESKTGGTGLGLSITKNLVELHGGSIKAESKLGYGTKISFNIPNGKYDKFA